MLLLTTDPVPKELTLLAITVPALIVVVPVYAFAPERVSVPEPIFVKPATLVLSMIPERVTDCELVSREIALVLFSKRAA